MSTIYESCPSYEDDKIILTQTSMEDANELLLCYSDETAVPFFNADNCHGDTFYYPTLERMKQAIEFWNQSYGWKYFVRWTVILKETKEKIGTIEMFQRGDSPQLGVHGVLRIDLRSTYETSNIIDPILKIANDEFYEAFEVETIIIKAIPEATERVIALEKNGYVKLGEGDFLFPHYFSRKA